MFRTWLPAVLLAVLAGYQPARALDLRVAIEENVPTVTLGSSTAARVLDEQGQEIGRLDAMQPLVVSANGQRLQAGGLSLARLRVVPEQPGGLVFIGERWFRGAAETVANGGRLTAINLVELESYLYGVVGAEMVSSWPEEALKAQAIAARTYALYNWNRRQNQPFDLGDTVLWQVYKGASGETESVRRAVEATAGQVLTFQGSLINAMYHSNSGGRTEDVRVFGTEGAPYLSVVEDFDQDAPYSHWQQTVSAGQLLNALASEIGDLLDIKIHERTPGGRALTVLLAGSRGNRLVKATDVRFKLGLRSTFFEIAAPGAGKGPIPQVSFDGRGFGHGIGMSQWGARTLATLGWNCNRILKHYYQGVELQKQLF